MIQQVDAVYEHGLLRPLMPLSLTELQQVRIIISDAAPGVRQRDMAIVVKARAEVAAPPSRIWPLAPATSATVPLAV